MELLKRLVNWMKGFLKGGLSNSKESNNGPGLWTRIISLLKLARHASEERTMEYRLNLRDTTPTGTAPREYVLLGTKRKVSRSSVSSGIPLCGSSAWRIWCSARVMSQACTTAAAKSP